MTLLELLDRVDDRNSFLEFARALQSEAEKAVDVARNDPRGYIDALGWAHLDIGHFLGEVLSQLDEHGDKAITWRDVAEWLWSGGIIE
jgi:hypothetical protein